MTKIRRALTAAAAAASAVVLASTPASAYPTWQAWNPPASYDCGDTTHSTPSTKVIHQVCIGFNQTNASAQAVLLVRNNSTVNIKIDSATVWWKNAAGYGIGAQAHCESTIVVPGELTACYGMTIFPGTDYTAHANYWYNGKLSTAVPEKI
ncbi:hypothetical protein AB0K02_03175 [Streptomyces sp. NPDC049597]|uniref:hypothetical protein n=1 Tax=Streptomyces sp. NPDC049597 TaxID=3155276 RepID=UPI00342B4BBA